ncbi:hypothetical protein DICPUDRAFT_159469 [Dictyostelium purpureum]|uniref:Transcription factor CBF/NF-Y/archaeal histone domain-containing protein n=1 Tax=Dictyostelium purpureum TaxID=5786 RepID=F1A475_DICPU|nr:uncharacterized protein DICPUDRAFT_159469 [Dictyostelium purpureum]EGC29012.1 hypothetical protein DICPUDRAFT_159469 [Dictyostelium purpureum]|eukprot:XP_003294469.1 hypothetical protein DICPUDRAFT_159469 [Dictyostelium purpureum]
MGDKNDDNLSLPKATVSKLIKEILPQEVKCSNETRDLILECCVEFIHLISSEANDICGKDNKRTIAPEHVIKALKELGFGDYIQKVTEVYDKHKLEVSTKTKSSKKFENLGKPTEQLIKEQQLLFAKARSAYQQSAEAQQLQQQQQLQLQQQGLQPPQTNPQLPNHSENNNNNQ